MRVSAKAEYGCLAMLELAATHGEPQPTRIKAIAEAHGLPLRFLVQILLQLKAAGLVASTRGASGGYQLTRPPATISLADVINAIDRADQPRPASPHQNSPAAQALHSVWNRIQKEEQRRLAEVTLADLARQMREADVLSYQI